MYLIPLLTLLGFALCVAFVSGESRAEQYLLPRNIRPELYDVELFLNPNNTENFTGAVSIRASVDIRTNEIVMHAMGMEIAPHAIQVVPVPLTTPNVNLVVNFTLATDDTQFLRIQLNRELVVSETVTIDIKYTSQYAGNMFGVYISTYNFEGNPTPLVTSQLQPTYARSVFPCFDEPDLKAIFRTTIYAPRSYTVVRTNMPLRNDLRKSDVDGWVKHEFQDTPTMSTYLNGYLVSNFHYIENNENQIYPVPFKIYSRPATQNSAVFALDFGQRSMVNLQNYIGLNYSLPKLDKVAVPDFAAGAMENWGLGIYREITLLVRDEVITTATKQNVAKVITHENIHLWIGNEVTPASWTYLWLTKGLATFFDHYGTNLVLPRWQMNDQFLLEMQNVFQSDTLVTVNPMTYPVYSPTEILGTFNAVAYQKAGSVMRMLLHILTPPVFQKGLSYYVQAMSGKAAVPADLYNSLERALNESDHHLLYPVQRIMEPWANQGGFPVVTVSRVSNTITVVQERYLIDRALNGTGQWYIPINWATASNPNFTDTKPMLWMRPGYSVTFPIAGLSDTDWFILNKQQTGYYRVNYDVRNWIALTNSLSEAHNVIHVLNRANILDDAFNLARSGHMNYNHTLDLSRYLINETDYIPWGAVNPAFTFLDIVLSGTEAYTYYQYYLRNITAPMYRRLGFSVSANEDHVTPFLRNIILDLNCRHNNDDCTNTAATLLQNFRAGQRVNPDIQTLVYCSSLSGRNPDNFWFVWEMYLNSTDSSQQSILLNALGCTTSNTWRRFYLGQSFAPSSSVRNQDRHTVIISVINSSPENLEEALDFFILYFIVIQESVKPTGTTEIFNAFARRLSTRAHLDKVAQLVRRNLSILTEGEMAAIAAITENIAASIAWRNQNAGTVEAWLKENYGSNATALTSSFILLISVFFTILHR